MQAFARASSHRASLTTQRTPRNVPLCMTVGASGLRERCCYVIRLHWSLVGVISLHFVLVSCCFDSDEVGETWPQLRHRGKGSGLMGGLHTSILGTSEGGLLGQKSGRRPKYKSQTDFHSAIFCFHMATAINSSQLALPCPLRNPAVTWDTRQWKTSSQLLEVL